MNLIKCVRCSEIKLPWRHEYPGRNLVGYVKYTKYISDGYFGINLNDDVCKDCALEIYDKIRNFMACNP